MIALVSGHSEVIGLYSPPQLEEFGTLAEMTADTGLLVPSLAQVSLSVPMMPPGGGGGDVPGVGPDTGAPGAAGPPGGEVLGVVPDTGAPDTGAPGAEGPPGAPGEDGEVAGTVASDGSSTGGGSDGPGSGEASGAGGVGAAGNELPFTGFAAAGVAALGGAMTAVGVALRRLAGRDKS